VALFLLREDLEKGLGEEGEEVLEEVEEEESVDAEESEEEEERVRGKIGVDCVLCE
jgi:hypothetical protein